MVGQGVLRECLLDDEISSLLTVDRSATGIASLDTLLRTDSSREAIREGAANFRAKLVAGLKTGG